MKIIKRNGVMEAYDGNKLRKAILAAFHQPLDEEILNSMVFNIEKMIEKSSKTVEEIQDIVEIELMQRGFYQEARRYILYREKRFEDRRILNELVSLAEDENLKVLLKKVQKQYPALSFDQLLNKYKTLCKASMNQEARIKNLIKAAGECISAEASDWEFVAGCLLAYQINQQIDQKMAELKITTFYEKIKYLSDEGYYGSYMLENYSKHEIAALEQAMDFTRDELFTYSGLELVASRYLIVNHSHHLLEKVQEMFMGIAMHLMINEKVDRISKVIELYDILSQLKVTMATPTMANARKVHYQLSSCFIDTVPDSLDGIYRSIDNFAQISKFGGGMGLYFGKVRAMGSDIRGYKGVAGGVSRWIKLANDTAVAVDQLGVRQGSVAVYLDVWHKDVLDFLQLRTNNGDDRMKAHDVFPALCYPDLFWKMASEDLNQNWHLMCPHEILSIKGYALEDDYGEMWEQHYLDCVNDERIHKKSIILKDLIRLIIKSAVETGTPFVFNRDHVNRMNPNKHQGIIYSSNLCTEITQNMSAIQTLSQTIESVDGEQIVVEKTIPGDFVVCNLASLVLGKIDLNDEAELKHIVSVMVRTLDNVIDLNFYPIPYAQVTNHKYRSIGLGTSGYHHMLAQAGINWESDEHLKYVDALYEKISYYAIEASSKLAEEKGSYAYFKGSEWENGLFFERRGYKDEKWVKLKKQVYQNGMRNAYLLAIAPTSSTSIIAGTSAAADPIMKRFYLEEKKEA